MRKKTEKQIWYSVGIAVLVGIAFLAMSGGNSGSDTASPYSASALTAPENTFSFGNVPINGGVVSHEFVVRNDGEESILIEKVYTSCMCTTALITNASGKKYGAFGMPGHGAPSDTKIEVGPGESATVMAIYDPAAHGPSGIGFADRSIYLETNSAKSPKLELSFQATVTP